MKTTFSIQNAQPATPDVVKSADRVLDLLELLGCATRPLGLAEVTHELGIPKSSALGLLRTLAARGYVARDEAERYLLAHPFGLEEGDWLGGLPRQVAALGRPVIETLVARTGETGNLGAMVTGFRVRPLIQVASPREIRYEPRAVECPAYCTAMGRVLPRTVPIMQALRDAGATDPQCAAQHEAVSARRAANMRLLVADLRAMGELR